MKELFDILYADDIEHLASKKINEEVYNSNDVRAYAIMTSMFRHARNKVEIICSADCTELSDDPEFLEALHGFLKYREGRVEIILYGGVEKLEQKKVYAILKEYSNQIAIEVTEKKFYYNGYEVHFVVADEISFRIETDVKEKLSRANFNYPEGARRLSRYFDEMHVYAQKVEIK